ncbi:Lysophosphatidylcholine acyltransferase 2 [Trichoplax sp. H2]|nr:Lysophosphatidylcholine acyltransferase 2 [Trichoplax sp. H2]|eukprot:RDD47173.1 Lysophosphatidylcholine acyltransferase 2 [Trichoplax sp. H2]
MSELSPKQRKSLIAPIVRNPFVHPGLNIGICRVLEFILVGIFLLPFRLLLLIFCVLLAALLSSCGLCCQSGGDNDEPLGGCAKAMKGPVRILVRIILFAFGFHWVKVKGKIARPEEAPLIVLAPHTSFMDIFMLSTVRLVSGVSRKENKSIPIIGSILALCDPIYVSRTNADSRKRTVELIKQRAYHPGKWPQTMIFPEGKRLNDLHAHLFRVVQSSLSLLDTTIIWWDTYSWVPSGPKASTLFWLILLRLHHSVEIEFLPVYHPNEEEQQNSRIFAANVRRAMASALNVPITDHTYEDCQLMVAAADINLPRNAGVIEYRKINDKLSLDIKSVKELLKRFSEIDKNGDGLVNEEEFSQFLNLPPCKEVSQLFNLYDQDDDGCIDFREYLIGLILVSKPAGSDNTLQIAFQTLDVEGNGKISKESMKTIMTRSYPHISNENVEELYKQIDVDNQGYVTYDNLQVFFQKNPEHAKIFSIRNESVLAKINAKKQAEIIASIAAADDNLDLTHPNVIIEGAF